MFLCKENDFDDFRGNLARLNLSIQDLQKKIPLINMQSYTHPDHNPCSLLLKTSAFLQLQAIPR